MTIVSDLIAGNARVDYSDQTSAPDFAFRHVQQQAELAIFSAGIPATSARDRTSNVPITGAGVGSRVEHQLRSYPRAMLRACAAVERGSGSGVSTAESHPILRLRYLRPLLLDCVIITRGTIETIQAF